MPRLATPATPVAATVDCDAQHIVSPTTARYYAQDIPERLRAVEISQGQDAVISWTLKNRTGTVIDLAECGILNTSESGSNDSSSSSEAEAADSLIISKVMVRFHDVGDANTAPCVEEATVVSASLGEVTVAVPDAVKNSPGIYHGEFGIYNSQGNLQSTYPFYVVVNRGLYGTATTLGPPSIPEIRLHLRDNSPHESLLLDTVMFDAAEIAFAAQRAVDQFNEIPPPLSQRYNTQTFPWRYHWMDAIVGNLFLMVAEQYRRNQLEYAAGGVAVNDQNKEIPYERAAQARLGSWNSWMHRKKIELNIASAFGGVGSGYGSYYY